jgi:hypothetical protein
MSTSQMHADDVLTDVSLVRRLLAAQLPEWAGLPIEPGALCVAPITLPCHLHANPVIVAASRHAIAQVLVDRALLS